MVGGDGTPNVPSPILADVGKGRIPRRRRVATLERRYDGASWRPIGRYGSVRDANVALDAAIGGGARPNDLRVVEDAGSRLLVIVGALVFVLALATVLYLTFG
jgi:hypothetical protein